MHDGETKGFILMVVMTRARELDFKIPFHPFTKYLYLVDAVVLLI